MTVVQDGGSSATCPADFLSTLEGEIAFFRSIMRARPVGIHRHFHILVIQNAIFKDTGKLVRIEDIWDKLRCLYDLDALDAIDLEAEGYDPSGPSPSPSENLASHPHFREEFTLPYEDFEPLIAARRLRDTVSAPSSPAFSPAALVGPTTKSRGGAGSRKREKERGKSKLDMAGLVGGDSDSSALTQESGDEGVAETPRESVVTGTDAGTEEPEEEDTEMREPSPASPRPARNRNTKGAKRTTRGRGASRFTKKRKR